MACIFPAPEVEQIGKKLVAQHHPHLWNSRVEYVFRETASKKDGKAVLGTARKVSGLNALLATPGAVDSVGLDFFVITIARDAWDLLPQAKREALVDHELAHCRIEVDPNGNAKLGLAGHDVEEFGQIIQRHGLWTDDLEDLFKSLGKTQLELFTQSLDGPSDAAAP